MEASDYGAIMDAGKLASDIYNSYQDRESRSKGRKWARGQRDQASADYAQMLADLETYYANRGSMGTQEDVDAYKRAIAGYDPNSFAYTPDKTFDQTYTKTRDDFLNPYMQQIIGDTAATVQHGAAGAALGRGSGAAEAIAKAVAEKNNEIYKEAQQEYTSDRDFNYQKYSDYIKTMKDALAQRRAATESKIALQGNLAQDYYNTMDSQAADKLRLKQDRMAAINEYNAAIAGLY